MNLRLRGRRLRERSRDLQPSSQGCRIPELSGAELQRLRRVEADLEAAIAECRSALQDVRRELRWQDPRTPPVVH